MKKVFFGCMLICILLACNSETKTDDKPLVKGESENKTIPQSEFADAKYTEWGKQGLKKFEAGDIDGWATMFSGNVVYQWSAGDSLAGKAAVIDYWKNRRATVIESLVLTNDIWLPLKVNTPQRGPDAPGNWLLSWHQVDVKYKNGKAVSFWVHTDYHYDANDKVDRVVQYMDRSVIMAATK